MMAITHMTDKACLSQPGWIAGDLQGHTKSASSRGLNTVVHRDSSVFLSGSVQPPQNKAQRHYFNWAHRFAFEHYQQMQSQY